MLGYFAQRIRDAREKAGISTYKLAELSGVPRPTIAHIERGFQGASERTLVRPAEGLGITMGELCSEPKDEEV